MKKILVCEDEQVIREFVVINLNVQDMKHMKQKTESRHWKFTNGKAAILMLPYWIL